MDPMCREILSTPLPALQVLDLTVNLKNVFYVPTPEALPSILLYCPNLRELRYNVGGGRAPIAPDPWQVASALTCVRLVLPRRGWRRMVGGIEDLEGVDTALEQLLGSSFPALERIVLDGAGWQTLEYASWDSVVAHRLRGRRVERGTWD
ncbi:hypothetical protein C8R46DRAFT_1361862 [Mycena filopes]|nr:hypothetical protein C8R46DRAFT_1361862 [Mycena filopes]